MTGSTITAEPRRRRLAPVAAMGIVVLVAASCASNSSSETSADAPTTSTAPAVAPCDTSLNPAGYYEDAELAGVLAGEDEDMSGDEDQAEGADDTEGMDGMDMGTEDEPMDMSGGMGEVAASALIVELSQLDEESYAQWLESLDPDRDVEAPDDTGQGGHLGPQTWSHITDEATCDELRAELDQAQSVAANYPKAADAMAAGYTLVAPYLPGIASHWMKFDLVDGEFDVTQPEMLLFDGNTGDANLVGLSYFISAGGDAEPSVGFTGDNDHYHRHEGLCIKGAQVIGDSTTSPEDCAARGGRKSEGGAGWMSHAWVVDGCESPWGVFSAQNPILDDELGTASGQGEPCSGSTVAGRWDLTSGDDDSSEG